MSSTRHAIVPGQKPEANASEPRLCGVNVSLNLVVHYAQIRHQEERDAMIWLRNYANAYSCTADSLSDLARLTRDEIRDGLTAHPDLDLRHFTKRVEDLRGAFDAKRERLASTEIHRLVSKVLNFALEEMQIVELLGDSRSGKTVSAWEFYLDNMHQAAWFEIPEGSDDKTFYGEHATQIGISVPTSAKTYQTKKKLHGTFHRNGIRILVCDEFHKAWPAVDKNGDMPKPGRIDFIRRHWDRFRPAQVAVAAIATNQHSVMMEKAIKKNAVWAPAQWKGRAHRFRIPEALSDEDIALVARHHGGVRLAADAVPLLVTICKADPDGYLGTMVNVILRAKSFYSDGKRITRENVGAAARDVMENAEAAKALVLDTKLTRRSR